LAGGVEQGAGHGRIVEGVEEANPTPADVLELIEQRVHAGADPPDRVAVAGGHPEGHILVDHGGMRGGEAVVDAEPERRDPVRVASMDAKGDVDEEPPSPQVPNSADLQAGHPRTVSEA